MRGYNDKQRVLLQKIFDRFRTLVIDLEMFAAILEAAEREYANFHMDQPYQHAMYNVTICTQNKRWHNDDYIAVCKGAWEEIFVIMTELLRRWRYWRRVATVCCSRIAAPPLVDFVPRQLDAGGGEGNRFDG